MDQRITRRDPLLASETSEYDKNGNITKRTDRKLQITQTTYDAPDRRSLVTYHDNSTTSFTYDAGNRLIQTVDSVSGTITLGYDGLDRVTSYTSPNGTLSYTHDSAGRRTSMTVSGQAAVTYTYDDADRLTSVTKGANSAVITYDGAGRRSTLTLPNSVVVTYGYDGGLRLNSLSYSNGGTSLGNLTYEYDDAGNRTRIGGSLARTVLPQVVASAVYDAANRLTQWNGVNLTYDTNGNLANDGALTYTWNVRDRLSGLTGPGVAASFQYDRAGRRSSRTLNGSTTTYLYDGSNIVQELTGVSSTNLLTGLHVDETFARTDSSGTLSLILDGIHSTIALLDAAGVPATEYAYEPFGKVAVSGAPSTNSRQYTGRESDTSTLYYYRARYYSTMFQRFISEDRTDLDVADVNLYAYVGNNPINYIDPDGLTAIKIWGWWCGPDWTGAKEEQYDPAHDSLYRDPLDKLDAACRDHDICYYNCRQGFKCDKKMRAACFKMCDRALAEAALIVFDPKNNYQEAMYIYTWMKDSNPGPEKNPKDCDNPGKNCKKGNVYPNAGTALAAWLSYPALISVEGSAVRSALDRWGVHLTTSTLDQKHGRRRFVLYMKYSALSLWAAPLMLVGAARAELELVMQAGMTITAETKAGVISITAGPGLKRTYTWQGASRTVTLRPRTERWYGSLGAYYSSFGDDWPEHGGITRAVLEEGQQHFESEGRALDWLKRQSGLGPTVYRDDGLVVSFDKHPHRTMGVSVWQIFIHGNKPKKLPGSDNDRITVTRSTTR